MLNNLRKSFLDKGIPLKESWLLSMIDSGLKSYESIFILLIDSDISETCEPCPLPDITRKPNFIFQENNQSDQIFLQINEVVDISLPLEKRKVFEASEKGTLKILLTDGVTNFIAISKKPITSFSTGVTPGSKLFVKTPIESRFGVIFLSEDKIRFLNGKSEQVIDHRNHIYSKITRSNKNQLQQQQSQYQQQNQISQASKNQHIQQERQFNQTSSSKFLVDSNDDDEYYSNTEEAIINPPSKNKTNNLNQKNGDHLLDLSIENDDDSFLEDSSDIDDIESIDSSDFDNLPSRNEKHNIMAENSNNHKVNSSNFKSNNTSNSKSRPIAKIDSSEYDFDSSDDNVIILDSDDDNLNKSDLKRPSKQTHYLLSDDIDDDIDNHDFSQIVNSGNSNDSNRVFTVKELKNKKDLPPECFETVKTSARITECKDFHIYQKGLDRNFALNVILTDSTGQIIAKVDPNYIFNIIQKRPDDFLKMKDDETEEILAEIEDYFEKLKPPILLYDRGGSYAERYTLTI